ncbi:hypothetical protein Q1695_013601 [Nippostrongylus brasiliensis]|nr:hypothetical protein Q1695_013601 [Nippostrongylus brasiliensis]
MQLTVALHLMFVSATAVATFSPRLARQSCDCKGGEPARCQCEVLSSADSAKNSVHMACSCSAPVSSRCVCEGTDQLPPPTPPQQMPRPPMMSCTAQCRATCLTKCAVSPVDRCAEACPDACHYSCLKQEKLKSGSHTSVKKSDYKFIIPLKQLVWIPQSNAGTLPTLSSSRPPTLNPDVPAPQISTPNPKICSADCMPQCSISCTAVRPGLKMLAHLIDGKQANTSECLKTCTQTCEQICLRAGMGLKECTAACHPTCEETCPISATAGQNQCDAPCMPLCTAECREQLKSTSVPVVAVISPLVVSAPPPESLPSMATNLKAQCDHSCEVQCARQCALQKLPTEQCESACNTTCVPVCLAKSRDRHRRPSRREFSRIIMP